MSDTDRGHRLVGRAGCARLRSVAAVLAVVASRWQRCER